MIEHGSLGDYRSIAEMILGVDGELLAKGAGISLADSALASPQASFGGVESYPEFEQKAAVLLEHLVKNHPLPDGNKRTAYAALDLIILTLGPIEHVLSHESRGALFLTRPTSMPVGPVF